jgi:hypothetical protein
VPSPPDQPRSPEPFQHHDAPGRSFRFVTPGGTPVPSPVPGEERRRIEEAMQELRAEADALRAELQRMRDQLESLPRGGAR